LWILFRLIDVEVNFVNAGLPPGAWLGMPCLGAQLDLAEFLHGQAAPVAHSFWRQRQAAVTASSILIEERVEPA